MPPSLLLFSDLLSKARDNDPLAKSALPAAKEEFFPPPSVDVPKDTLKLSSGAHITPFNPKISARPQEGAEAVEGGSPTEQNEGKPGWFSENKGDLLKLGITGLAGLFGEGGQDFGRGFGAVTLRDMQQKQAQQLSRRQKAWETAYEDAQQLPPEVFSNPELSELRDSYQALMKDMQDGKIDNEKTLSSFLLNKSKYSGEIEQAKVTRQLQMEKEAKDRQMQEDFARRAQQVNQWEQILKNPEAYDDGTVKLAQQAMQSMPELVDTPYGRIPMTPEEKMNWALKQDEIKARNADRAQGHLIDQQRLGIQRRGLDIAEGRAQSQEKARGMASAARAAMTTVQNTIKQLTSGDAMAYNPKAAEQAPVLALRQAAPIIERALGLQVLPPKNTGLTLSDADPEGKWSVIINGQEMPLDFDPSTDEGKDRLLREAFGILQSHATQDLSLSGAYGGGYPSEF